MNDVGTGITLTLNRDEATALASLIGNKLGDLAGEVYKTEDFDYRNELKAHEALLRSVLARLPRSA